MNNIPEGLYVSSVEPGSAASDGGIRTGDVIIKADGEKVNSVDSLNEIRDTKQVGQPLTLEVYRNGNNIDITIYLKEDKTALSNGIND